MNATDILNDRFQEGMLFSENIVRKIRRPDMEWLFFLADLGSVHDRDLVVSYMSSGTDGVYEIVPEGVQDEIAKRPKSGKAFR